jgi:predicted dehydrogenase
VASEHPNAKKYVDFRKMLEKQKDLDAIICAVPDHLHGVVASMAIKMGLHVYCEKPLAHSVYETRKIVSLAKEYGVQTQMGNQGHSSEEIRRLVEWVDGGLLGDVTEVHACVIVRLVVEVSLLCMVLKDQRVIFLCLKNSTGIFG